MSQAEQAVRNAGGRCGGQWGDDGYRYTVHLPRTDGRMHAFVGFEPVPGEIGAAKRLKKFGAKVKKAAKSKAFGKVLKAATAITAVVPGAQGVSAALAAGQVAARAAKKAKKGVKGIKALFGKGKKKPAKQAPKPKGPVLVKLRSGRQAKVQVL